ncbi:MAG: 5-(carboxyamino)imidazole ribonucleotide mutase [Gammaproteobacteria bacterium TMED78]|nr:MAG: 5-(carboxyamino)imidazole ribonucleotide mutase [Gammaproteobacteria bacterium TMED78]|tara:strand:- start:53114 stop:53602 length:489 start_codon:yes stop_codon:yes gene_type:complete
MDNLVGIIMGSASDWDTMSRSTDTLDLLGISYETRVISAHRAPDELEKYSSSASDRGVEVIIAGAGGAAALPGVIAAKTIIPVLGVPILTKSLGGMDSLLSMVQMPAGIPVATLAIGNAGATNAALFAAAILSSKYPEIEKSLQSFRAEQTKKVLEVELPKK